MFAAQLREFFDLTSYITVLHHLSNGELATFEKTAPWQNRSLSDSAFGSTSAVERGETFLSTSIANEARMGAIEVRDSIRGRLWHRSRN